MELDKKWDWVDKSSKDFSKALDLMLNTDENLFIFGPGGVGKSILLRIAYDVFPNALVLGPTGVSAANLVSDGVPATTIHSALKIPPVSIFDKNSKINVDAMRLVASASVILIDEISMVNASMMDYMLKMFLKAKATKPRVILFGDLFQLPPVVDSSDPKIRKYFARKYNGGYFFFNAMFYKIYKFNVIHLNEIYRQKDPIFKTALNNIRLGLPTSEDLSLINTRVVNKTKFLKEHELMLYLASTNRVVNELNAEYSARPEFDTKMTYEAITKGNFNITKNSNADPVVKIAVGQQVMCIFNNKIQGYQNGTMGKVISIFPERVIIQKNNGERLNVVRETWQNYELAIDKEGNLKYQVTGSCEQIACKPAFSVTMHKSQGLTLESVFIDLSSNFIPEAGIYLALSRCTSLEGIGLSRSISDTDIKINSESLEFFAENMEED